jgi:two-component system OmpR family response regulator
MKTGILRPLTAARWTSGRPPLRLPDEYTHPACRRRRTPGRTDGRIPDQERSEVSIEPRGDTAEARILAEQPDLVILDVMLTGQGWLRGLPRRSPQYRGVILMLTARDEDFDQILGLEMGADDYIAKPVQPRVLLARIKALLRRLPTAAMARPAKPKRWFSASSKSARRRAPPRWQRNSHRPDHRRIRPALAARQHAGNVLSRDDLLQELRGIGFDGLDRSIDARISRLRKKLNDDPENPTRIKTVRGKGYLFSKHDWN